MTEPLQKHPPAEPEPEDRPSRVVVSIEAMTEERAMIEKNELTVLLPVDSLRWDCGVEWLDDELCNLSERVARIEAKGPAP